MSSVGWTGATLPAALCLSFALTTSLGIFIVAAAASLRQDAILLNFTIESLEGQLKRIARVDFDLTHCSYQRDLRSLFLSLFLGLYLNNLSCIARFAVRTINAACIGI
jgi:hypothetical protein